MVTAIGNSVRERMKQPPLEHLVILTLGCVLAGLLSAKFMVSPVLIAAVLTGILAGYLEFFSRSTDRM